MIQTMYDVMARAIGSQIFVLRRFESGKVAVKEQYRDLVCKTCGKVKERAALARGLQPLKTRLRRPFVLSDDDLYLVDEQAQGIIKSIVPNLIDFFPIPTTKYFVATPRTWVQPDERDPGFQFCGARCLECGRAKAVGWGKVPPKLGGMPLVFAVNFENLLGSFAVWMVSKDVVTEFRKHSSQLTGMSIGRKEIEDGV